MELNIIHPLESILVTNHYSTNSQTFINLNRNAIQYYINMQRQLQILKNMKKLELS